MTMTDATYRTDTVYEETDGFFFIDIDGKKVWFDTAREALLESGFTRVYRLYQRNSR
jgi:hypothetical protein